MEPKRHHAVLPHPADPSKLIAIPIHRAPIFLRITQTWDDVLTALCCPDDTPAPHVRCWCYEKEVLADPVVLAVLPDDGGQTAPPAPTRYRRRTPEPTSAQKFNTDLWRRFCVKAGDARVAEEAGLVPAGFVKR